MANPPTTSPAQKRRRKKKFRLLPMLILLALIGGGGWYAYVKMRPADNSTGKMLTEQVTRGDLVETVNATGSVTAQTGAMVKIGTQVTGRIRRLYADVGSIVRANEVIAELDLPDIEAQYERSQSDLESARVRLKQQENNLSLQRVQTETSIAQAQSAVRSAEARLKAVQAQLRLQTAQTPTNISRAEAELARTKAALSASKSSLSQVEAGARFQVTSAQEQVKQAKAQAQNSAINLKRQQDLLQKGFVAASIVDAAVAADAVNQSLVQTAEQNLRAAQEQSVANIQAAKDQVTQAQKNVESADAALEAAKAGTYTDDARRADVNDAQAQLAQAKIGLQAALANKTQIQVSEKDVQAAREAVRSAEADVRAARARRDYSYIRSPITGTVLQLASQQGETLAAGLSSPTLIIVADLNRLQIDVFVDETDIGKIKMGQEAEITVDAFPGKKIKGKVTKVASGSTIQQGVITYAVTIAIEKTNIQLKPDMTAAVTLVTGRKTNVILVPAEAVKIGARGATVNVMLPTPKGEEPRTDPRPVQMGASDGVYTEIVEGLEEGETIVLAGMDDGRRRRNTNNPFGPQQNRSGGGGGGRGGGR